jgi:hypothetical protein
VLVKYERVCSTCGQCSRRCCAEWRSMRRGCRTRQGSYGARGTAVLEIRRRAAHDGFAKEDLQLRNDATATYFNRKTLSTMVQRNLCFIGLVLWFRCYSYIGHLSDNSENDVSTALTVRNGFSLLRQANAAAEDLGLVPACCLVGARAPLPPSSSLADTKVCARGPPVVVARHHKEKKHHTTTKELMPKAQRDVLRSDTSRDFSHDETHYRLECIHLHATANLIHIQTVPN